MKQQQKRGRKAQGDVWFTWAAGGGWSGGSVEAMLRRYGIPVTGRRYAYEPGDDYGIRIPGPQAIWAEYVMTRAGVALTSPLLNPAHAAQQTTPRPERSLPPSWGKPSRPRGVTGWVVWLLGEVMGLSPKHDLRERSTKGRR